MHQNNFGASDHRPKILGLSIAESDSDDNFLPVWWKVKGAAPAKETAPARGELRPHRGIKLKLRFDLYRSGGIDGNFLRLVRPTDLC